MSSSVKRITAWFGIEEWEAVYYDLFSNDHVRQKHAVARIAVWKSRIQHRLSSGIECTWYLMSALIQDRELQQQANANEEQLRLAYAMAIVRFVNHLTEKGQNRPYVQAVHVLAEELGLPLWLVEMRHDATHASLPSLPLLRCATQYALAWIKREYWDAIAYDNSSDEEDASPTPQANETMYEKQLSGKLVEFMQEQFNHMAESARKTAVKSIIGDLRRLMSKCREKSISLLTSEGYLILTESQLEVLDVDRENLRESSNLLLPKVIVRFWEPVIDLCQSLGLLPQLLMSLGQSLSDRGTLDDRLKAGWIVTITKAFTKQDTGLCLKDTADKVDGLRLLKICIHAPNVYTSTLIKSLFASLDVPLSDKQKNELVDLLQCYSKNGNTRQNTEQEHRPNDVYTVDSLLLGSNIADNDPVKQSADTGAWQLAGGLADWVSYPIGSCPHINLTHNNLELDSSVDKLVNMAEVQTDGNPESQMSEVSDEESILSDGDVSGENQNNVNEVKGSQLSVAEITKHVCLF